MLTEVGAGASNSTAGAVKPSASHSSAMTCSPSRLVAIRPFCSSNRPEMEGNVLRSVLQSEAIWNGGVLLSSDLAGLPCAHHKFGEQGRRAS